MTTSQGYGTHPTIYGSYSDEALYALFRGETWFQMDENGRQQLLQETVNRAAAQNGELGACEVRFADLNNGTLGQQSGNVIEINRDVFVHDRFVHEYGGHIIEEHIADSNLRALETVLHEDIHAWQNQCINGTIQCSDKQLLTEYRANDFTVSIVSDPQGLIRPGSHYLDGIQPDIGYYLYYFQSSERDAHMYSEKKTIQIMEGLRAKYGDEKSFLEYQRNVLLNGYNATLQKGQEMMGNVDFEKEINKVLVNSYYGTNLPVDPKIEAAVKKEMAESYQNQISQSQNLKEGTQVAKDFTPVTIEDYDKNMRDTVNAFYEHAINDSTMSREEAIAQTSQMAENYLNTMEELETAHENGEIASVNDELDANTAATAAAEAESVVEGDAQNEVENNSDTGTAADNSVGSDEGGIGDDDDGGIE